jgi:thioredoxin reductase/bacterioferritin-associated ferredoxin
MTQHFDVAVLGAGPAGAEAACVASDIGLSTVIIDEATAAGGQVYRAPAARSSRPDPHHAEGDALRRRLDASQATRRFGDRVWDIARTASGEQAGYELSMIGANGLETVRARSLIVATGATERFYPRPGWTLPGVVGLAAATILVKSSRVLPGSNVVVAGAGPLLSLVAHLILEAGGRIAAIVDVSPLKEWTALVPRMAARPDLLFRGLAWQLEVARKKIPVYRGFDVTRVLGETGVEGLEIARTGSADKTGSPVRTVISADAVCLGYGLTPATEVYRLLGASHVFDPARGGWIPELDTAQRTSVPNLYGAGDGAGLLGAAAAPLTGSLAALSAANDLGKISASTYSSKARQLRAQLAKASRFGEAMAHVARPRPFLVKGIPDATIVCRCEDITAGEVRAAVEAGAKNINALKFATRCGMGPCGGRMCGEAAASLMECDGIERTCIGQFTARPPLRPISLGTVTGDFQYSDIPLPEPAPA